MFGSVGYCGLNSNIVSVVVVAAGAGEEEEGGGLAGVAGVGVVVVGFGGGRVMGSTIA